MTRYLYFLFIVLLTACNGKAKEEEPEYIPVVLPQPEQPKSTGYYCPMKCEGEKVYDSKRYPCPVCKMKLVHTK